MLEALDEYAKITYCKEKVWIGAKESMTQHLLFDAVPGVREISPFKAQLLKWIGNKQRFAHEIASFFPCEFGTYYEPFIGSGAVMATFAPWAGVGSDVFGPLIEIWHTLVKNPTLLKSWYEERWHAFTAGKKVEQYERLKASYNSRPNGADLLFLCRSCYGGVVRFRQRDGFCSTPCGIHDPISPESFSARVDEWYRRLSHCTFRHADYRSVMAEAKEGDIVYCDPPYSHSQAILYGAQGFSLVHLLREIAECKARGVFVALSIDGTKRTGELFCKLPVPKGLFKKEVFVNCGRSMLRRFQMGGETLEGEVVHDRLLLTQ
jgi:DNA adenine methylase